MYDIYIYMSMMILGYMCIYDDTWIYLHIVGIYDIYIYIYVCVCPGYVYEIK